MFFNARAAIAHHQVLQSAGLHLALPAERGSTMAEIKPRWEWRSFGERFGPAEAHIAKLSPTGVQESDELYLLSGAGANVKVRDALMDIKVLREVNADGLEQWTPVMKGSFPLPAAEVAQVLQALGLPLPDPVPDALTQDDFMARFAAPGGPVRAVPVHKRRVRYIIGGCTAELSEVTADGRARARWRWSPRMRRR